MFPGIYGANQKIRKVFQVSKNGSFSRYVPQERHIILPRPMSSIPFVFLVDLYSVTADILVAMPVEGTRRVFKFVRPHNRLRFFLGETCLLLRDGRTMEPVQFVWSGRL